VGDYPAGRDRARGSSLNGVGRPYAGESSYGQHAGGLAADDPRPHRRSALEAEAEETSDHHRAHDDAPDHDTPYYNAPDHDPSEHDAPDYDPSEHDAPDHIASDHVTSDDERGGDTGDDGRYGDDMTVVSTVPAER
jgi:hypothetical protein